MFAGTAAVLNIAMAVLGGDVVRVFFVFSMVVFAFSAAAATLTLQIDPETDKLTFENTIADFMFLTLIWPLVEMFPWDLGHSQPPAGERGISGAVLMFSYGTVVPLIGQNLLIAMLATTYQKMLDEAIIDMKVEKFHRVVRCADAPLLPCQLVLLEYTAMGIGRALHGAEFVNGGWQKRPAFPWERKGFKPAPGALDRVREAQRLARIELLGKEEVTVADAKEGVRRMSSNRHDREAQPSAQTVRHIVKAEVSDLRAEVMN